MQKKSTLSVADLGPVIAGFQLAVLVVGFFGIGQFASWIIQTWRPFTHWAWQTFFEWLNFPLISDIEKDALTSVAFFLPMATWALLRKLYFQTRSASSDWTEAIAVMLAMLFFYIVSGPIFFYLFEQLFGDVGNVQVQDISSDAQYLARAIFSSFMIVMSLLAFPSLLFLLIFVLDRSDDEPELENSKLLFVLHLVAIIATLLLLGMGFSTVPLNGPISALCLTATLICIWITLTLDPRRLMVTFGAFLAFGLASVGYESAIWISEQMRAVPG